MMRGKPILGCFVPLVLSLLLIGPCAYAESIPSAETVSTGSNPAKSSLNGLKHFRTQKHSFQITFVIPKKTDDIHYFIESVSGLFPDLQTRIINRKTESLEDTKTDSSELIIALGKNSLAAILKKNIPLPVLTVFATSYSFNETAKHISHERQITVSAIYSEPPLLQQLQLIQGIYLKPVVVALVLPDQSRDKRAGLLSAAKSLDIELAIEIENSPKNLFKTLRRIEQRIPHAINVVLIEPSRLFPLPHVRNVISSSLHQGRAVIGYSSDTVRAGAMASVYADINHIIKQTADFISIYLATGELPPPTYSQYFDVAIHNRVANSLGVEVPDKSELLDKLAAALFHNPGAARAPNNNVDDAFMSESEKKEAR